jgi:putative sterol carrier protein
MTEAKTKIEKPADWFEKVLPERITKNQDKAASFKGTFSFNIAGDTGGEWAVSLEGGKLDVKKGVDASSAFTIAIKDENFVKLMNGELSGQVAFMTGKLKFKGNMGTAMKLQWLLF